MVIIDVQAGVGAPPLDSQVQYVVECTLCICKILYLIQHLLSSFLLFKFTPTVSAIILPILKQSVLRNR